MIDNVSSTSQHINLVWAYEYPDLLTQTINKLFEQWGNLATFSITQWTESEVCITATRNEDDHRTPLLDVMEQKAEIQQMLEQAIDKFVTAQRANIKGLDVWVWEQYDKTRNESLQRMIT